MTLRRFSRFALVLAAVAVAPSARAQLGDPFDAASLANALKGMRVYRARMTEISAMRVQYLNVQNRRSDAQTKGQSAIDAYQNAQSKFRECMSEKLKPDAAQTQKMQQKMMSLANNPTVMQKYAEASQAASNAAMKGDTTAMKKATADMMKVLGFDLHADTVAATAACGGAPKAPAAVAEVETLERQADSITVKLRRAENAAEGDAALAAGVVPARFAQMRERLETYANKPGFFTGKEAEVLAAHKAEIIALTKTE